MTATRGREKREESANHAQFCKGTRGIPSCKTSRHVHARHHGRPSSIKGRKPMWPETMWPKAVSHGHPRHPGIVQQGESLDSAPLSVSTIADEPFDVNTTGKRSMLQLFTTLITNMADIVWGVSLYLTIHWCLGSISRDQGRFRYLPTEGKVVHEIPF